MKIFPYSLIRLGGESYEQWARMDSSSISKAVFEIIELKKKQKEIKENLCDKLFTFIESLEEQTDQNIIQNVRRDLFNERKVKNNNLNKAREVLTSDLKKAVDDYLKLVSSVKTKVNSYETCYNQTINQNRKELKKIVGGDGLKKGLLLSSKSLLDRVESYITKDINTFRKKEFQIEQGLIKYATRLYTKTSPFSTFTNLSLAELKKNVKPIDISHVGSKKVKSHIRLNNNLLKYIFDLFKNYKDAYLWLHLRPNPTLEKKDDHFLYLTNNNNIESFQRIPYNPVVELIIDIAGENKVGVIFNELLTKLRENIDATDEELEVYVKQLLDYGCLEYNMGVSGIDPDWDIRLVKKLIQLKENNVPHISSLIEVLKKLRNNADNYAERDDKGRVKLLNEAHEDFRAICMTIHKEAGLPEDERKTPAERQAEWRKKQEELKAQKENSNEEEKEDVNKDEPFKHKASTFFMFKPQQMFYEDTTREAKASFNEEKVYQLIKKLDTLMQSLKLFEGMQDEKLKMTHYFLKKYKNNTSVNLLTFYEDYFREYKKPLKEYEENQKKEALKKTKEEADSSEQESIKNKLKTEKQTVENPFLDIPHLKDRNEKLKSWSEKYSSEIEELVRESNGQVDLSLESIKKTNAFLNNGSNDSKGISYGSFIQFYIDDSGQLKAVINGTFAGYGKMLSRFLHIFDDEVTSKLNHWNDSTNDDDSILIEDCDASYFNANLHPPLMPYEIWMPGGHNTLPEEKQIPITDFSVHYDGQEKLLKLKHKPTGKNAQIFDLGFQGSMGRSQLFQLLNKFSKAEYIQTHQIINTVNSQLYTKNKNQKNKKRGKPEIRVLPRIIYEDQIILQRKTWNVPKECIPHKMPYHSDWEYYLKINEWRKTNDMPDEVFVFINPDRWGNTDPELANKLTRDDYKPQYIDFRNPLLINLMEKLITKAPSSIKIREMLPSSSQMLKIDSERFVSEFVIQWYK